MIIKRINNNSNKQTLVSLIVIALTTVIVANVQAGSVSEQQDSRLSINAASPSAPAVANGGDLSSSVVIEAVPSSKEKESAVAIEPRADSSRATSAGEKSEVKVQAQTEVSDHVKSAAAAAPVPAADEKQAESESEANKRKGRSEQSTSSPAPAAAATSSESEKPKASSSEKPAEKSSSAPQPAKLEAKAAIVKPSKPAPLVAKSASKSKLPANLGTVTSTGSGGPAHYMSKHDAYSAIAEKHGALAQDAMRKSDKRSQIQGFGGIQKASGLGDMLGDTGLARTLGASMRSIMKSKYSVPAYVASALLGAVALLAFYESPMSPLPVPALPEPPFGRFPPETPILPANTQIPYRPNQQYGQQQQQNYNQRSFNGLPQQQQQSLAGNLYQQQQQVLFPGANNAQQRQMVGGASGPVQQLAANLLSSVGKQQIAQRKSSPDYEQQSISRSLFSSSSSSSSASGPSPKMSSPANQQKQNSFLGFFGLGGGSSSAPNPSTAPSSGENQPSASAPSPTVSSSSSSGSASPSSSVSANEGKNQPNVASNGLSNSHLVNKVKSYFTRVSPASGTSSSSSSVSNSNPYDKYQKMSFVQALIQDTAFLPGFLSPNRKSSSSPTGSGNNKAQSSLTSSNNGNSPAARMQVDGIQSLATGSGSQIGGGSKQKPASSGYGLNRIAHALLETFTSGIAQRSAQSSSSHSASGDLKSSHSAAGEDQGGNQAASLATSLISDLVSSYSANVANSMLGNMDQSSNQQSQPSEQQQQAKFAQQSNQQQQSPDQSSQQTASARSATDADEEHNVQQHSSVAITQNKQQAAPLPVQQQHSTNQQQQDSQQQQVATNTHVRKTRSIGFEYPIETNHELAVREQQPSKAAQINNVIDFVADSYSHNRLLFNFVMNQVGLSQAVPYVEQILASGSSSDHS